MTPSELLLGLGAIITAAAGALSAWSAIVKARAEGSAACEEELHTARSEAETYTSEVHRWRMAHPEGLGE